MKPLLRSFNLFIYQISRDSMLIAVCAAPILTACFFRFGIPSIEQWLCASFDRTSILQDYYLLFDLFLALITPYMLCFASSMVMLTEYDENMVGYLSVTPIGKRGYILSRLLFPAILSFLVSVILLPVFSLTRWTFAMIFVTCFLTCMLSIIIALLIFSFSHNRVEGLAMAKLSGLFMLGLPIPFFIFTNVQYWFSFLPSYWIAKQCVEQNYIFSVPALLSAIVWMSILYRKFDRKLV